MAVSPSARTYGGVPAGAPFAKGNGAESPQTKSQPSFAYSSSVGGKAKESKLRIPLSKESQESIIQYAKAIVSSQSQRKELHGVLERLDIEYARQMNLEKEHLEAERENRVGKKRKIQDITVPVLQPQTESGLAYLTGVFLTGYPIFGVVADVASAAAADQMEAVISEHSIKGQWNRHLMMALRDALKYNLCCVEVDWKRQSSYAIGTDSASTTGKGQASKEIVWEGNAITWRSLYNTFFDYRVAPAEIHTKGEFAGYVEIMGRTAFKQFLADLPEVTNAREALESTKAEDDFYIPEVTSKLSTSQENYNFDWMKWATTGVQNDSKGIKYGNCYEVKTLYCRILPADFGMNVPAKNIVQIWKFVIVNGKVVVYVERMTNAHNYLPLVFAQPIEDGLGLQTQSFAENLLPIQDMASALWNIKIAGERRNVTDRMLYDPTRIRASDINSDSPNAKIPARPGAYGKPISESVYQIPFRNDSGQSAVQDAMAVVEFGRSISGINRAQEGQFIKGNRTLSEFDQVMQNSNARLQTLAIFLEAQFFTPIKEIIKINILQYLGAGKFYSFKSKAPIPVNPVDLRNAAIMFKISDGLLPSSKIINSDFLMTLIQVLGTSQHPTIMGRWDVGGMIAYLASTQNAPDLKQFEIAQGIQTMPGVANAGIPQPGGNGSGTNGAGNAGSA